MRIPRFPPKNPRQEILRLAAVVGLDPTIGALAKACGLDRDTVGDVLERRKPPRPKTVKALAAGLHTTPEFIRSILAGGVS